MALGAKTKSQPECKAKGISPMTEADCKAKKGTVVADAKPAEKAPAKK